MKQALHPNHFSVVENIQALKEEESAETVTIEQQAYHYTANTPGWKQFEELTDRVLKELDDMVREQMASGVDYVVIGQSTVAKELTKDVIRRLINTVRDAKDAVDARGAKDGGK